MDLKLKFTHNPKFIKVFETFVKCKLYYGRASSYTGIPMSIAQDIAIYGTFLKVYGWFSIKYIIPLAFILILVRVFLGRLDYHNGLAQRETEIINRYNPDLQYIKKKVRGK